MRIYQYLIFDMIGALNGQMLGINSWRVVILEVRLPAKMEA